MSGQPMHTGAGIGQKIAAAIPGTAAHEDKKAHQATNPATGHTEGHATRVGAAVTQAAADVKGKMGIGGGQPGAPGKTGY